MVEYKSKSLGILGGSFDPPHFGHLKLCEIALKKLNLKKIFWVVTKKNPLKKKVFFPLKDRILKSKKISKDNKKIKVVYLEKKLRSTRTINLVKYLKKNNTSTKIFLLMGSDNLISFHKWKNYKKILDLCEIVVFSREGYDQKAKKSGIIRGLKNKKIKFIKNKKINISSTILRKYYSNK
ncbi:MAG: nicotinate (nicotinamide) nucleotide adenylyltransferase [Pelagibacteraceae bacterium TMED216]|nr:MAG: nicotinate (nicotinamide) nucleotide adenylyltransferase [Pelagibacteraceae bacterium TMED216]|tara:strand:+ start:3262 stop:3801 length:540 start_codon:yes stop_codon:yes gene_type:complete